MNDTDTPQGFYLVGWPPRERLDTTSGLVDTYGSEALWICGKFKRAEVRALHAHLGAWLETGSLKLEE